MRSGKALKSWFLGGEQFCLEETVFRVENSELMEAAKIGFASFILFCAA
jgi:hypothetical protein